MVFGIWYLNVLVLNLYRPITYIPVSEHMWASFDSFLYYPFIPGGGVIFNTLYTNTGKCATSYIA